MSHIVPVVEPRHEQLAEDLADARRLGTVIPNPEFPISLDAAYDVQERVTARLGGALIGWKVGSTSKEAQARLGTDEPGAGRLIQSYCFRNGEDVPVSTIQDVHVEVEFAFRIGSSLPPRRERYVSADLLSAIETFMPAMEIVGSRFAAGLGGSGRSQVTADGGANVAFVSGAELAVPEDVDLRTHACSLAVNGEAAAAGTGARALGDPVRVLCWLANHLSGRGLGLAASSIVTTGTCTGLISVSPGDLLRADFGHLGQVETRLTAV